MEKFNPFAYILILEECLKNPNVYEKDKLIKFMDVIKENKDQENFIEIITTEINKMNGGSTVDAIMKKDDIERNIERINVELKTTVENAINDIKNLNVNKLLGFITDFLSKAKKVKNLRDLGDALLLTNYGLKYLIECQKVLHANSATLKEEFQDVESQLNSVIGIANKTSIEVEKFIASKKIPPDGNFYNSVLKYATKYHKDGNNILKNILKTNIEEVNLAAAKSIMASCIALSVMTFLNIYDIDDEKFTMYSSTIKKIIEDDLKLIANDEPELDVNPDTNPDTNPDINVLINDIITILKKKCTPQDMMDTFIEIVKIIDTPK